MFASFWNCVAWICVFDMHFTIVAFTACSCHVLAFVLYDAYEVHDYELKFVKHSSTESAMTCGFSLCNAALCKSPGTSRLACLSCKQCSGHLARVMTNDGLFVHGHDLPQAFSNLLSSMHFALYIWAHRSSVAKSPKLGNNDCKQS